MKLYRLLSHVSHFDIANPVGPELGMGRPLKQPVSVCITSVLGGRGMRCKQLKLGPIES